MSADQSTQGEGATTRSVQPRAPMPGRDRATPAATAWAERAAAAVALHDGEPARAAALALTSATGAEQVQAPIEAALSRTVADRALAQAGDRAIAVLQRAATDLDACGALPYRDAAEREPGRLGHRVHRRTRPGKTNAIGIESLTERELQVARTRRRAQDQPADSRGAVPQPEDR